MSTNDEPVELVEIEEVPANHTGLKQQKTKEIFEVDTKSIKWKRRRPVILVSGIYAITFYLLLWAWVRVAAIATTHYTGETHHYAPLIFGKFNGVHFLTIIPVCAISIFGWLLSTRVPYFQSKFKKASGFFLILATNAGIAIAYGMTKVQNEILPFFYARIDRVIETNTEIDGWLVTNIQGFFFMLIIIPLLVISFAGMFVITKYRLHDKELIKAFWEFKLTGERLRNFENESNVEEFLIELPRVELGISKGTNEMIVLPGFDRPLNTIITGSIGTGKTAALALPILLQDLHYFTRFINLYPTISQMDDYISVDVQGRFLNGITIIEPSNELCKDVYKLAKAHGIADEAITYIDPMNSNTPNINPMKGPTEKVAEVFAQVIAGLGDSGTGGMDFFAQAQRNHLKQFIYLLKMHEPEKEVTFDMLIDMYNNTQIVHEMHMKLKARFPMDFNKIDPVKNRDIYNTWQILKGVDEWFDNVIVAAEERTPRGTQKVRNEDGTGYLYEDKQAVNVQGLRNILNDISSNIYIRRVLFGTSTFDFDKHMGREGGILLVNTAKGDLEELGSVLGKIILMTLQNAAFRREPKVSAYHHILVDEFPEYIYRTFASFPAQSRKYKVIITVIQQTLTQLRGAFGEDYMNTLVAAMRNRMVYADVSNFDGKYFSEMFGEKEIYQEAMSEQSVSPLQDDPVSRTGSNYSKVREAALSASDVLFQDAYECAVKIVIDNKSMPVEQIKANFIAAEEFVKSKIQIEPDAMAEWILNRFKEIEVNIENDLSELEKIEAPIIEKEELIQFELKRPQEQQPQSSEVLFEGTKTMPNDNPTSGIKEDEEITTFVPRKRMKVKQESTPAVLPTPSERETPLADISVSEFIRGTGNRVNYNEDETISFVIEQTDKPNSQIVEPIVEVAVVNEQVEKSAPIAAKTEAAPLTEVTNEKPKRRVLATVVDNDAVIKETVEAAKKKEIEVREEGLELITLDLGKLKRTAGKAENDFAEAEIGKKEKEYLNNLNR